MLCWILRLLSRKVLEAELDRRNQLLNDELASFQTRTGLYSRPSEAEIDTLIEEQRRIQSEFRKEILDSPASFGGPPLPDKPPETEPKLTASDLDELRRLDETHNTELRRQDTQDDQYW